MSDTAVSRLHDRAHRLTTKTARFIVPRTMTRIDHVAVVTGDPEGTPAFYARILGARIVETEGHPVMAYVDTNAFAFHEPGGPGEHTAVRVSEEEREKIKLRLIDEVIAFEERDHGIGVGLFFRDPEGRLLEAITYHGGDDPRRPAAT